MVGRVFVMGAARGFPVVPASTVRRMLGAFLGPAGRAHLVGLGEQARLDNGLVPR